MGTQPFVSIIIPVYNVAPYLRECLDSVLAQTFPDWEAICVDDGSTDGSGAILDEYAARDSRILVIHQPNSGVSVARNAALDVVKGNWFLFLDGDDLLREDGLELFFPFINAGGCNGLLVSPRVSCWDGGEIPKRKIRTRILIENASKEDLFLGPYAANGFPFSRIYQRTVFGHLRFPIGVKMAEDVHFWFDALCISSSWKIINAEYYLYRQREDSVCGKKSPKDCVAVLDSIIYACGKIKNEMGLGQQGIRQYVKRWPCSPCEYLSIFVARHKEMSANEKKTVFAKVKEINKIAGEWPFTKLIRCELLLIEHHLTVLMPMLQVFYCARATWARGIRFMCYVGANGVAFSAGKIKRFLLKQGEYAKDNQE